MFIVRLFVKLLLKVLKWLQEFVDQSGLYQEENKMVIFDRKAESTPVNFGERATEMERQHCWIEALYYQHLSSKFNSSACMQHADELLQRFTSLS